MVLLSPEMDKVQRISQFTSAQLLRVGVRANPTLFACPAAILTPWKPVVNPPQNVQDLPWSSCLPVYAGG